MAQASGVQFPRQTRFVSNRSSFLARNSQHQGPLLELYLRAKPPSLDDTWLSLDETRWMIFRFSVINFIRYTPSRRALVLSAMARAKATGETLEVLWLQLKRRWFAPQICQV